MEHVARISHGKDSMAMLEAIKILGLPLDRITTSDVWATETIQACLPEMVEWKEYADKRIKRRYGIEVEHLVCKKLYGIEKDKVTFEDIFYRNGNKKNPLYAGNIYGFPVTNPGCWAQKLKKNVYEHKAERIEYLGIAADEENRILRHSGRKNVRLPLVEIGWDEWKCRAWCEKHRLLAPTYTETANRDGCWFCPKQGINQLRRLYHEHPELWSILLKWDSDSPVTFHADGTTVHDYDERFRLEDEGWLIPGETFRWDYLRHTPPRQITFDFGGK